LTMTSSLRTMLFVPGHLPRFLDKAAQTEADALILDVEDSVPPPHKAEARRNVKDYLDRGVYKQQVFIRVNAVDTGMLPEDLRWTAHPATTGFMFTKICDRKDIHYFDRLLTQIEADKELPPGKFKMCPLIETACAGLHTFEIATASPRLVALAFGGEDYLTDLDGLHRKHGLGFLVPRALLIMAARAARLEAIDTPYLDIHDDEGFLREVTLARELGFSGQLCLHPNQIPVANRIFAPSEEEIREATRIVNAIEEGRQKGLGVGLLDGSLIGPPMEKRARAVLRKVERIRRNGEGKA
jgi:citrate lyase subunit beta / citryl-CoA lyase